MANNEFFVEFKPTTKAGKRAAIYVRVSRNEFTTGDDGEKELRQSVKNQKEDGIRHCEREGWEYELYDKDCELSGTFVAGPRLPIAILSGKGLSDPDMKRMMKYGVRYFTKPLDYVEFEMWLMLRGQNFN